MLGRRMAKTETNYSSDHFPSNPLYMVTTHQRYRRTNAQTTGNMPRFALRVSHTV